MAGADRDAFTVDDGAEVVRVNTVNHEREHARFVTRSADHVRAGPPIEQRPGGVSGTAPQVGHLARVGRRHPGKQIVERANALGVELEVLPWIP